MSNGPHNSSRELIAELGRRGQAFSLEQFAKERGYPLTAVAKDAERVLVQMCARAARDGVVTDKERRKLYRLAGALGVSATRFETLYSDGAERVFSEQLEQARADGTLTETVVRDLEQLRETLGLTSVGWFDGSEEVAAELKCQTCGAVLEGDGLPCTSCGYRLQAPLPVTTTAASEDDWSETHDDAIEANELTPSRSFFETARDWFMPWGVVTLVTVVILSAMQTTLTGPQFIRLFLFFGIALLIGGLVMRFVAKHRLGHYVVAALLAYELVAMVRLGYGWSQGMSRFSHLIAMMVGGPLALFVVGYGDFESSSGILSGCSGCSSCGGSCGGGCGGGGCGGCS